MTKLTLTKKQRRQLERQLKNTHDARLYRRTLAVLEYDRGKSIVEIARTLRVNRRSIYRCAGPAIFAPARVPAAKARDHAIRSLRVFCHLWSWWRCVFEHAADCGGTDM